MDQLHRMTGRRPVRARAALAGLALAAVALAGCSGDDPAAEVPDGFAVTATESFAIHHPAEWEVLAQDPAQVRVAAPGEAQVRPAAAVTVDQTYDAGAEGFTTAVEGTLTVLRGLRADLVEGEVEDVDIAGAEAARLVTSRYTTGGDVTVDHVDVFALADDGRLVHARAEAPAGSTDPEVLRRVVTSLDLT